MTSHVCRDGHNIPHASRILRAGMKIGLVVDHEDDRMPRRRGVALRDMRVHDGLAGDRPQSNSRYPALVLASEPSCRGKLSSGARAIAAMMLTSRWVRLASPRSAVPNWISAQ